MIKLNNILREFIEQHKRKVYLKTAIEIASSLVRRGYSQRDAIKDAASSVKEVNGYELTPQDIEAIKYFVPEHPNFKEAEDFDLSDNPLVGNYEFRIGEKAKVLFAQGKIVTVEERIDNGSLLRYKNEGRNYPIMGVDPDLKDEIMADPWYLVKFEKPYKIRKDNYTHFLWLPQYYLHKVVVKEIEDFDLSDNPISLVPLKALGSNDVLVIGVDASRGLYYDGSEIQQGRAQDIAQSLYDRAIEYCRESAKQDAENDEDENEDDNFNYCTEFIEINPIDEGCYIVSVGEESFHVVIDGRTRNKAARELVNYIEGDEEEISLDPAGVDNELFGNLVNDISDSINEVEDFDLSDNPLVGDPATELAYAKFDGMDWIDLKNDGYGKLSFGNRYNKYVFNTWDEWVNWLADEATSLQHQNLRAFDITPFLPIQNGQFESAKSFFKMYQKKNNGAPFILMYKK